MIHMLGRISCCWNDVRCMPMANRVCDAIVYMYDYVVASATLDSASKWLSLLRPTRAVGRVAGLECCSSMVEGNEARLLMALECNWGSSGGSRLVSVVKRNVRLSSWTSRSVQSCQIHRVRIKIWWDEGWRKRDSQQWWMMLRRASRVSAFLLSVSENSGGSTVQPLRDEKVVGKAALGLVYAWRRARVTPSNED